MMVTHYSKDVLWLANKLGLKYHGNHVGAIVSCCSEQQLHTIACEQDIPESVMREIALNRKADAEILDLVFSKKPTDGITLMLLACNPNASDRLVEDISTSSSPNARDTALSVLRLRHKALA